MKPFLVFPSCMDDEEDLGIYLHIPFCARRCHFCAFYLVVDEEEQRRARFVNDLKQELVIWASSQGLRGRRIGTVYFGGGTPTMLSPRQLNEILECVYTQWTLDPQAEITIESTPERLSPMILSSLKKMGCTRLSLGVQTFNCLEREQLGLFPGTESVDAAITAACAEGFGNISVDLMYGLPGQSRESWIVTLDKTLSLGPTHLSCYAMTIEEGTRLFRRWGRGALQPVDSETDRWYQEMAAERLDSAGYVRYEISNWAQPGFFCRHNLRYWQGQDYLGAGPSAQSYVSGRRWGNVPDLQRYSQELSKRRLPMADGEVLTWAQQQKERVVFGLRKIEGIPVEWVEALIMDTEWRQTLQGLVAQQLVALRGDRYKLTAEGRRFADTVGQALM